MKHLRWIIAMAVALAMAGFLAPQVSAADPINGWVVGAEPWNWDPATGFFVEGARVPLAGVTVTAYALKSNGSLGRTVVDRDVTDEFGAFSLTVGTEPVGIMAEPAPDSGWQPSTPVPATFNFAEWPLVVEHSYATGQVVNQSGAPIRGATVRYTPVDFSGRSFTGTTDADGWYMITGLDYSEYEIRVSARGYLTGWVINGPGNVDPVDRNSHGPGLLGTLNHQIRMTAR